MTDRHKVGRNFVHPKSQGGLFHVGSPALLRGGVPAHAFVDEERDAEVTSQSGPGVLPQGHRLCNTQPHLPAPFWPLLPRLPLRFYRLGHDRYGEAVSFTV